MAVQQNWTAVRGRQGWWKFDDGNRATWKFQPIGTRGFNNFYIIRPTKTAGLLAKYFIVDSRRNMQVDTAKHLEEAFDKVGARMMRR